MFRESIILFFLVVFFLSGCEEDWDNYYYRDPGATLDQSVWEIISEDPDYSIFIDYILENDLDSIFTTGRSVTVFVPSNNSFTGFYTDSLDVRTLLCYHIVERVLNVQDVEKSRLIETSSKKYALIEREGNGFYIDGSEIIYFSPLCKDGRIYELKDVLLPRPNLYEYISVSSKIYKRYIDRFEEIQLDVINSVPLGFDDEGNTIYDSVFTTVNRFDTLFFPVNKEFRRSRATVILFDEDQYLAALDEMADKLGEQFNDHADIPEDWQFDVLLPMVVRDGIFDGSLQYSDFLKGRLKNIAGDSVYVDYTNIDEQSRFICSNGVVFKYKDYTIPEQLYLLEKRVQGEHLIELLGVGVYGWKEGVTVSGSSKAPLKSYSNVADNDSLVTLELGIRYSGAFMLEFTIPKVFPQRYRLEWRAISRPSGFYEVYVNDEKIGEFDLYYLRNVVMSVTGEMFIPSGGLNSVDFEVNNITHYGDVKIGIKYIKSGLQTSNGFTIDYMALIPF